MNRARAPSSLPLPGLTAMKRSYSANMLVFVSVLAVAAPYACMASASNMPGRSLLQTQNAAAADKFWVFGANNISIVNPTNSEVQEIGAESACNGELSSPVQMGGHVLAACESQSLIIAFDATSGEVMAKVDTCNTPQRLATVPWRSEVYVQCRDTPASSNENEGGIVHVINTQSLDNVPPLVNALRSPKEYRDMSITNRSGILATDKSIPNFAFSANAQDPGIHKINMNTKEAHFINLESVCPKPALGFVISARNQHGFLKCEDDKNFFHVEVDLMHEKYMQTLPYGGEVHTTDGGRHVIVLDSDSDKLYIFKANGNGKASEPVPFDEEDLLLFESFGGFAKLVFAQEGANVAVISSSTANKVLVINMEDIKNRKVIGPFPGESPAGYRGRVVSAGTQVDGHMYALVSADLLYASGVMHVVDMGDGTDLANSEWLEDNDVSVDWSQPLTFIRKPAAPRLPDNFWVFGEGNAFIIDPTNGKVQELEGENLCDGQLSSPVQMGEHVLAACESQNHVVAFDLASGEFRAKVDTCNTPQRLATVPWRSEVYVQCRNTPESSNEVQSGIVHVIDTRSFGLKHPLVNALRSPEGYNNMSIPNRGGILATDKSIPDFAFSANAQDPGIHKINMDTRESHFINLESVCAKPALGFVISAHNQHGLLKCEDGEDFFHVEVDLVNEKYIQTIDHGGEAHTMDAGRYFIVLDNDNLHMFEAKSRGQKSQTIPFAGDNLFGDFGGFAKLVFAQKEGSEGADVAVISSSKENKVLVINMDDMTDRKVIGPFPGESPAGYRGRVISAGTQVDGHMYALVAADLLYARGVMHVVDMGDGTDLANSEWLEDNDVSVDWSKPLTFIRKPAAPKTDKFWVFDEDEVLIVDPTNGEVQKVDGESLCNGELSAPVQMGEHVLAACESQNHVAAFDAASGEVMAKINTCNTPQLLASVPWRSEVYVQCRDTPENSNEIQSGIVHVISTRSFGQSHPMVNALRSPEEYSSMPSSNRGGILATDKSIPDFAFSVNTQDPGIHKINMDTKESHFINLESVCTKPALGFVISAHNQHGLLKCEDGGDFFHVEVDLMNEKYIQTISLGGEVHTMDDGQVFIVLDDDNLNLFEAKSRGQKSEPVPFDQDNLLEGFGGFAKLVFAQTEGAHVAVVSSSTLNKVLIINMEDVRDSKVIGFPGSGLAGFRGRVMSAGTQEDGHMYALVSADLLFARGTMHIVDMGDGTDLAASEWLAENDVNVDWSKPLLFVNKPAVLGQPPSWVPSLEDLRGEMEEAREAAQQARQQMREGIKERQQQMREDIEERQTTVENAVAEIVRAIENAVEILVPDGAAPAAATSSNQMGPASTHQGGVLDNMGELEQMLSNLLGGLRTSNQQQQAQRQASANMSQQLKALRSEVDGMDDGEHSVAIAAVVIACVAFVGMSALAAVVAVLSVRGSRERAQQRSNNSAAVTKSKGSVSQMNNQGAEVFTLNCDNSEGSKPSHDGDGPSNV